MEVFPLVMHRVSIQVTRYPLQVHMFSFELFQERCNLECHRVLHALNLNLIIELQGQSQQFSKDYLIFNNICLQYSRLLQIIYSQALDRDALLLFSANI